MCARGSHFDIFKLEWLACTPAYGSLALDDFPFSFRHGSIRVTEQWSHTGATAAPVFRGRSDYSKSREAGPYRLSRHYYISMSFQNIYYKRVSTHTYHHDTIAFPPQKKKVILKNLHLYRFDAGQAGHRNVSRMLRLL